MQVRHPGKAAPKNQDDCVDIGPHRLIASPMDSQTFGDFFYNKHHVEQTKSKSGTDSHDQHRVSAENSTIGGMAFAAAKN